MSSCSGGYRQPAGLPLPETLPPHADVLPQGAATPASPLAQPRNTALTCDDTARGARQQQEVAVPPAPRGPDRTPRQAPALAPAEARVPRATTDPAGNRLAPPGGPRQRRRPGRRGTYLVTAQ